MEAKKREKERKTATDKQVKIEIERQVNIQK